MEEIYRSCPEFENNDYILRMVRQEDRLDLLKVYSDKEAVSFFNSDNCGGDDFFIIQLKTECSRLLIIGFLSIIDRDLSGGRLLSKETHEAIGTIELFHRDAADYFTDCGLLRLDIRSDYEMSDKIIKILSLIIAPAYRLFHCSKIATKAIPAATERIQAFEKIWGFELSAEKTG